MAREIPQVVRAAAGLAATVLDEARKLPTTLPGLPVRVIGLAMQKAMWLQQQYSGLVARGDELFTGIRGDQEPGMATFDDDDDDVAPVEPTPDTGGYRESAFDRAAEDVPDEVDAEYLVEDLAVDELSEDELVEPDFAPNTVLEVEPADVAAVEEVLEELAIEELVDDEVAGLPADPSPADVIAAVEDITTQVAEADLRLAEPEPDATGDADALENALLEADAEEAAVEESAQVAAAQPDLPDVVAEVAEPAPDVDSLVDVLTPDGAGVETVAATVTDEGVATPVEATDTSTDTGTSTDTSTDTDTDTAVATDEGGTPVAAADADGANAGGAEPAGAEPAAAEPAAAEPAAAEPAAAEAAGPAPIEGYDSWSIAQLRGRLRGYQAVTVESLIAYEEATRAREPYLRMLRNRLQKLDEQAVAASPLAPRGTGA
jgi:hypothetical protein